MAKRSPKNKSWNFIKRWDKLPYSVQKVKYMKWYILLSLIVSVSAAASAPSQSEKIVTDKVTCPAGYQLIDGTYKIVKGAEGPQSAKFQGNTLIVKYKKTERVQAIAVCARIPL